MKFQQLSNNLIHTFVRAQTQTPRKNAEIRTNKKQTSQTKNTFRQQQFYTEKTKCVWIEYEQNERKTTHKNITINKLNIHSHAHHAVESRE